MKVEKMRKYVILALGVAVCLIGAALMAFGEGLLGENHAGIATVIGIVGIGLIGIAGSIIAGSSKRSSEEAKSSTGGVLND
jgi:deoxyinosine 3'endonuclease (endonuclease V)